MSRSCYLLAALLLAAPGRSLAQETRPPVDEAAAMGVPPAPHEKAGEAEPPSAEPGRFHAYLRSTLGSPVIYARAAGQAGLDRATGTNKWDGADGYALRAAAHLGRTLTGDSIHHGVAAVFGTRVEYERSGTGSGWSRVGRAVSGIAVTTREDGTRAPNVALWSGRFGGAAIANAWFPSSYTMNDAARSAAIGLAATAGVNVIREFAPELKRLFR